MRDMDGTNRWTTISIRATYTAGPKPSRDTLPSPRANLGKVEGSDWPLTEARARAINQSLELRGEGRWFRAASSDQPQISQQSVTSVKCACRGDLIGDACREKRPFFLSRNRWLVVVCGTVVPGRGR